VNATDLANAIPAINNLFTVASVGCVFPTYFLRLRPGTYRLMLSLGIVFGLSTLAIAIAILFRYPFSHPYARQDAISRLFVFSPLNLVLILILARIKRMTRVGLWSTVVLVCVIVDWAGISGLFWILLS
jgi:hypothetical protein